MLNRILKFLIIFAALSILMMLATRYLNLQLGHENYWDHHGLFFLFFLATFPRLTLLFSSVVSGGFLWWMAWLFAPRILVALLATLAYWQQNPILVAMAWLIAIGGESSEKYVMVRRARKIVVNPQSRSRSADQSQIIDIEPNR